MISSLGSPVTPKTPLRKVATRTAMPVDRVELQSAPENVYRKIARTEALYKPGLIRKVGSSAAALVLNPIAAVLNGADTLMRSAIGAPIAGVVLSTLTTRPTRTQRNIEISTPTTASVPPHQVEVVHRQAGVSWNWNELLRDRDPHFVQRNFHPRQVLRDAELIKAFGTSTPHSGDVVLHYAGDPPQNVKKQPVPVILIHGASKNGNYWKTESQLADHLREQGFQVYAVTFAHNHDDNLFQAQALANAIDRVKQLTKAPQVDLIGHSKGGVAARAYTSNLRYDWMTPYRGDVRRLVLAATPNGGIDYSFRHPTANFVLATRSDDPRLNAPMSWNSILTPFGMRNTQELGFGKEGPDYFPGQRQILERFDDKYALPIAEQDWYTTYHGGRGFVSTSEGIDRCIEEGDNFIQRMRQAPIDAKVQVCILAGNNPNIAGIMNEYTGPSDGLLFLRSALDVPKSANVVAESILPLNHKSLVGDPSGLQWITDTLAAPRLNRLSPAQRGAIEANG